MDEHLDQPIEQRPDIDADVDGKLATALFIGVIFILLIVIYAFAAAA